MSTQEAIDLLELGEVVDRPLGELSGGELQRTAIAATILKDSDVYFFDEPSSYLDIYQRIKVARIIQELSVEKQVVVIEHDLAILDFLADNVCLVYGSEGAFGVFAQPRQVRISINTYLDGYLREENIRFRDYPIVFEERPPRDSWQTVPLLEYDAMECHYPSFRLRVEEGTIKVGESVGVVGPNAIGKTTFVKVLAGVMPPTMGQVKSTLKVSYKPQYINPEFDGTVHELFLINIKDFFESGFFESEIAHPLTLKTLYDQNRHVKGAGITDSQGSTHLASLSAICDQ